MATLTKSDFLSGKSLARERVTVESLGGDVNVVELSPRQRVDFAQWVKPFAVADAAGEVDVLAAVDAPFRLLTLALRDDDGQPLFAFTDEDAALLGSALSADDTAKLVEVARRISGMTEAAVEEAAAELPNSPDASAS